MTRSISALPVSAYRPVASWRHTASIVAVMLALVLVGALFQHRSTNAPPVTTHPHVIPLYLQLLVMEWALFFFVWKRGLQTTGTTLRDVIGGRWASARDVAIDLALASLLLGSWKLVAPWLDRLLGPAHAASIVAYLPRGVVESVLWVALSLSAGFSEEFVFRGYFQRQFEAWTGNRAVALVLQAALFGVAHAYQGVVACVKIACFGAFFGLLALWRRSLRPGMIAHATIDILSGIFRV